MFTESTPCASSMLNARTQIRDMRDCRRGPKSSHPCMLTPVMPHVMALLSFQSRSGVHFSSPQAELGCGSGFGLLDASKYDTSKRLESICALGFVAKLAAGNPAVATVRVGPRLACWMMRMHGHQVNCWTCESQGPLGLPAPIGPELPVPQPRPELPSYLIE